MKKGLILEGGAMRGMFTAGVLDILMENKIEFDGAVGTSAGAAFGCNYKSNQIGRAYRYNARFCNDKRYCGITTLIKTGDIYGVDFCYNEIPKKYDIFDTEAFTNSPMEFYATATDIETGKPVYHKCTDGGEEDIQWFRASASMPVVSRIVEIGDKKLLDGGLSDPISVKFLESMGYDRNVVVLTQPYDFVKTKNKALPIVKMVYKQYPQVAKTVAALHIAYNETTDYIKDKENKGELFVIRPDFPLNIKPVEHRKSELERVYSHGRDVGTRILPSLAEYLNLK